MAQQWKEEWEMWVNDVKILIVNKWTEKLLKEIELTNVYCITTYYYITNLKEVCFVLFCNNPDNKRNCETVYFIFVVVVVIVVVVCCCCCCCFCCCCCCCSITSQAIRK